MMPDMPALPEQPCDPQFDTSHEDCRFCGGVNAHDICFACDAEIGELIH